MWKGLLVTFLLVSLVRCGKSAPSLGDIDLQPTNEPTESADSSNISSNNTASPDIGTKVFNAPLILIRGDIPQRATKMQVNPGV